MTLILEIFYFTLYGRNSQVNSFTVTYHIPASYEINVLMFTFNIVNIKDY